MNAKPTFASACALIVSLMFCRPVIAGTPIWSNVVGAPSALTDASTVTVNGAVAGVTPGLFTLLLTTAIGSTRAIGNPTNTFVGEVLDFVIQQPATGSPLAVTWGTDYTWVTGAVPVLATAASAYTEVSCRVVSTAPILLCYGPGPPAPSFVKYTSTSTPLTLPNTDNLVEEMDSTVAITVQLNATGLFAGYAQCVADDGQNFYLNNTTVVTTDSSTINGQTGSAGIVENNLGESICFVYDGISNWIGR